jgi:uncharacterized LabA/DUF88 family protein
MERVAVFVDAGYVYAQGSACLSGRKVDRRHLQLDHRKAIETFEKLAETQSGGVPLLRVYWYDGAYAGPSADQLALAHLNNVKVRLGFINRAGMQKGVDSLIITDIIDLARNKAICDAVLVTGDEDLRVGVQVAQEFGVRVHLVGIIPSRGSQSLLLLQEADTTHELSKTDVGQFLSVRNPVSVPTLAGIPAATAATLAPVSPDIAVKYAVEEITKNMSPSEVKTLLPLLTNANQVPHEFDRRLLGKSRAVLGRDLTGPERSHARLEFIAAVKAKRI